MSPLVTRPSLPEPGTVAASMPLSTESLRTDGASGASAGGTLAVGAGAAGAGAGAAALAGAAAGFAAAPAAPSLICPSSAPTATVSPSLAMMSPSVPADGAGTSMVTLSVSSSTNGSSTATASPAFLNQRPMVASVTDSPSVGTRISVMVCFLSQSFSVVLRCEPRRGEPRRTQPPSFEGRSRDRLRMTVLVQRLVQQSLELRQMLGHQTGGCRGRRGASGVAWTLVRRVDLVQHPFEIGLDEVPRAHIARLFLTPDQFSILEASEFLHQRLQRHRIKLLDAHDVDIVDAAFLALVVDVVIDLARTQHAATDLVIAHELDLFVGLHRRVIVEQSVEGGVGGHFIQPRNRVLVPQQRLRRHQDQGLANLAMQLTPQHMEEICRCSGIDHLHVVFSAHLQEA